MEVVENIDRKYLCHFEHEFVIAVLSYITNIVAFLVWICMLCSIFGLIYYTRRFRYERSRTEYLDTELIPYVSKFDDDDLEMDGKLESRLDA